MPLKEIEQYLTLAASDDYALCYDILAAHKLKIEAQAEAINEAKTIVNFKLDKFQDLMKQSGLRREWQT